MTTQEFIEKYYPNGCGDWMFSEALEEYTKIKCKELLEIVAEKAKVYNSKNGADIKYLSIEGDWITVDKDSILNAVDLDSFII